MFKENYILIWSYMLLEDVMQVFPFEIPSVVVSSLSFLKDKMMHSQTQLQTFLLHTVLLVNKVANSFRSHLVILNPKTTQFTCCVWWRDPFHCISEIW
jgi:hypothetical protein